MTTLEEKIDTLNEQILCGGCGESFMQAVDAQTATIQDMKVADYVPSGCAVALVCWNCTTIEDGDERL